MVTVLDLKSRVPRLTTDVGIEVYGLRIFGDIVVVGGSDSFVTLTFPVGGGDPAVVTRVRADDIPETIRLQSASAPLDLLRFAVRGVPYIQGASLYIYDVTTGELIAGTPAAGDMV